MTGADDEGLAAARRVADAVLYEGYVLFPYRATAGKNRYRWSFGVVIPEAQAAAGTAEPAEISSQCLLRAGADARVAVVARFLQVRRRQVERLDHEVFRPVDALGVAGDLVTTWDEGVEREVATGDLAVAALLDAPHDVPFVLPSATDSEQLVDGSGSVRGRIVRSLAAVDGVLQVSADRLDRDVVRLHTVVGNRTPWSLPGAPREEVTRRAMVGTHLLLSARDAVFASQTDPPAWARPWSAAVANRHTFPVLAGAPGRGDLVLSAPIILPDHPTVAPESSGDAYDATEIDELLTLSVRALTDEEKRLARATDPRAADVVDRADALPPAVLERLHGAIRRFDPPAATPGPPQRAAPDRRDDLADELAAFFGVDEAPVDRAVIAGREVAVGDRVRLRPRRRADAQDLFAAGRVARVERIEHDLEGQPYVAVTLEDDPGADLHSWSGRFLYFHPEEIESLQAGAAGARPPQDRR